MTGTAAVVQPKIALRDIRKTFRWTAKGKEHVVPALGGVDFDIRPNEFLTVIGPSGCGKTTLLRILANLATPDTGSVLIDGQEVTKPGPERAMVFQAFGLFPWKTVLDNVTFPLTLRKMPEKEAKDRAREQLKRVGLEHFESSHPHQLSGGMQQRVGLARALVTEPDILLMDEPFGAIDAQTREFMQEELMKIWADTNKTVVFITHDLDEAVLLSDRILVLSRGPGTVRRVVDVDLPRPRWEYDVRSHATFATVRHDIWQLLRGDLQAQTEEEARGGH
ncbi:MAG: ATP-binding cassette domain-containing protein [Propionibacteriales bacterium]|nr:ATP-binding cassette domain-containing protein [Propionibacteriales bacterium]